MLKFIMISLLGKKLFFLKISRNLGLPIKNDRVKLKQFKKELILSCKNEK